MPDTETQPEEVTEQEGSVVEQSQESEQPVTTDGEGGGTDAAFNEQPTEETQGQQESTEEQGGSDWLSAFHEAGFTDVENEEDGIRRAIEAAKQYKTQIDDLAEQNRIYRQQLSADSGNLRQQAQSEAPQQETSSDPLDSLINGWSDPPAHLIEKYIEVDQETGQRRLSASAPQELQQQVANAEQRYANWVNLLNDPRQFVPALEQRIERMIEDRLTNGLTEHERANQTRQAVGSFFAENQWLFETDPYTNEPARDYVTGEPKFSREGAEFNQLFQELSEISDVSRRLDLAKQLYDQRISSRAAQPEQRRKEVQPVAQQRRQEMRGRANAAPSRPQRVNGVSPDSSDQATGQSQMTRGQRAAELLRQEGQLSN